jgi:hypothetical protein
MPLAGAGAMMVFMSLALHHHLAGIVLPSAASLWARHALESTAPGTA